jgi:hypothetical protein
MAEAWAEEEKRRQEVRQHLLAWHAANIMNASGNLKRPVTAEKLLGKKRTGTRSGEPVRLSPEEKRKKLEELKKIFGRG